MKPIIRKRFTKFKRIYSYEKDSAKGMEIVKGMKKIAIIIILAVITTIIEDLSLEWKKFMIG